MCEQAAFRKSVPFTYWTTLHIFLAATGLTAHGSAVYTLPAARWLLQHLQLCACAASKQAACASTFAHVQSMGSSADCSLTIDAEAGDGVNAGLLQFLEALIVLHVCVVCL